MRLSHLSCLTARLDGVTESRTGDLAAWRFRGRLVARQLDGTHIVIRTPFDARDLLIQTYPETFSVPSPFAKHMMVVADCEGGDDDAIEDAIIAAWRLQCEH